MQVNAQCEWVRIEATKQSSRSAREKTRLCDYVLCVPLANPHDTYIIYYMCVIARVIDVITGPSMLEKQFQICSHKITKWLLVQNMFQTCSMFEDSPSSLLT
jgi:hypothetical protein